MSYYRDSRRIVDMTPFVYENGKCYYFNITDRGSDSYYALYVYEKSKKKNFWGREKEVFIPINSDSAMVGVELNTSGIKDRIYEVLSIHLRGLDAKKCGLKDWDGFVGNIPEDVKKSLRRDDRIKNILED